MTTCMHFCEFEQIGSRVENLFKHIVCTVIFSFVLLFIGMTAVCCTYPLDVLRARIAFQLHGEHMYSGVIGTVRTISQQEGKIALFRGMIPTLLGMVPYGGKGLINKIYF